MTEFTAKLAGIAIGVSALHETAREYCAEYVVADEPELRVALTQADIDTERRFSALHNEREGIPVHNYSDEYLETLALYRKIAEVLLPRGVIVFHGAVLAEGGRAYLFTAPSGTGKTTHARNWLATVPDCHVLNGDKPLLRIEDDRVIACGTPWMGKERMGCNESLPLAGICLLERDDHDHIGRIDAEEALTTFIAQSHRPDSPTSLLQVVELVDKLSTIVPIWRMGCTPDEASALVSWRAMSGV